MWFEISYRKPPGTVQLRRFLLYSMRGKNRRKFTNNREGRKEAVTDITMRLSEQFLELVSVFKEANRNLYFSLEQGRLKI